MRGNRVAGPPGAPSRPRFQYMAPFIESATPTVIDTAGGITAITLTGWNFGPVPWSSAPSAAIGNAAAFSVSLPLAPSLPTTSLRIQFSNGSQIPPGSGPQCVSSSTRLDGRPSSYTTLPFADCLSGTMSAVRVTQQSITFLTPPGVGNRTMYVTIVDGPAADPMSPNTAPPTLIFSNPINVGFMPPVLSCAATPPLRLMNGADFEPITLSGFQFGPPAIDADAPAVSRWTPADRSITVALGPSYTCANPVRALSASGQGSIACGSPPVLPAGEYSLSVNIAGQWAASGGAGSSGAAASCPYIFGCEPGFFGREGERCAKCPSYTVTDNFNESVVIPMATCAGYDTEPLTYSSGNHLLPQSVKGWFNLGPFVEAGLTSCPPAMLFNPANASDRAYVCLVPCSDDAVCAGGNTCETGYTSLPPSYRCSSCDKNYFKSGPNCLPCPAHSEPIIVFYILIVLGAVLAGYMMSKWGVNIGVLSIGVDFAQVRRTAVFCVVVV